MKNEKSIQIALSVSNCRKTISNEGNANNITNMLHYMFCVISGNPILTYCLHKHRIIKETTKE
jgi:hypothetical protein